MTTKHFEAILAKNDIARAIRDSFLKPEELNLRYIVERLKDIEAYTGEANQPSVIDILTNSNI